MSKNQDVKYDPKKDKLNINYDEFKKMKKKEESKDYLNVHDFKFFFYYIPESITQSVLGIRLGLIVKIMSLVYAYRSMVSLRNQIVLLTVEKSINYIILY